MSQGYPPEEIRYEDRVLAYTYGAMIEEGGGLPVINLGHEGASPVLLRRNEAVHFAKPAQLKEMKTVEVGYVEGS